MPARLFETTQRESCAPAIRGFFRVNPLTSTLTHSASLTSLESALTKRHASASNKAALTPAYSALTRFSLVTPLESALTKKQGGEKGGMGKTKGRDTPGSIPPALRATLADISSFVFRVSNCNLLVWVL